MVKNRADRKLVSDEGEDSRGDLKSELVRLSVRRVVEEVLEAATKELLERDYYERRQEGAQGYRNGYREGRLKTSEGEVPYAVPQVRAACSEAIGELRSALSGKTEELERLALEMFARGYSYRDIEATFRGEDGRSLLSRSALTQGDRGALKGVRGVRDAGAERAACALPVLRRNRGAAAGGRAARGGADAQHVAVSSGLCRLTAPISSTARATPSSSAIDLATSKARTR